jgi:pyruvate, water dikinase
LENLKMKNQKAEKTEEYVQWFENISIEDVPSVGGKNASLGEMYRELADKGVKVPNGFAVTAHGYEHFLEANNLGLMIDKVLSDLDTKDISNLRERGAKVRQLILNADIPKDLASAIVSAYTKLGDGNRSPIDVAVRSSATAEDLPDASFAGQQETFLNVQGESALLDTCRRCYASLFTDRAISYRTDKGFDHLKIALSIGIQMMVRSDLATSGVMFSIDTETGFNDAVLINASYGLGENVVQGSVNPDEYYVHKPTLKKGFRPILQKVLGSKEFKLIYDIGGTKMVKNIPVPIADRERFALSEDEILVLAKWACIIEDHYSDKKGTKTPMDMEWAKDGRSGELFIVQARPETVQSRKATDSMEVYRLKQKGALLVTGRSVGEKIAKGKVRVVKSVKDLSELQQGEVLVTDKTDPDWEPAMKRAAAIVTDRGGRTCHAAIVSRELGLPAVVGTSNGTETLKNGQEVTISCAEGEAGFVYEGLLDFEVNKIALSKIPQTKTKIMMNVANPEEAFRLSLIPNDGVGLAREEFIISNWIGIHPLALLNFDQIKEVEVKASIERITKGYENKSKYFVDRLAQGVGLIAAAFYPKEVIVRMSDFKTNEYAGLIGGKPFEPQEENPMLGFRGASRYYDPRYRDGFALECQAMEKVRDEMGLTNVKIMIPFCRTVEEAIRVTEELEKNGLRRGENGLELYVMCEIPSNVILAEQFAKYFDGFSIGSNDLTQLILGVDRDSEIVAHVFDERNEAVKEMIALAIARAKASGKKIGICGQAPSDYPEFAKFLVRQGIDSISLNPDAVLKTRFMIAEAETHTTLDVEHDLDQRVRLSVQ